MQKFSLGINFGGQATPTKIKPMKICTKERLAIVANYDGILSTTKIYPYKKLNPEI